MLLVILSTMLRVAIASGLFVFFAYASLRSRLRYSITKTVVYIVPFVIATMLLTVLFLLPSTLLSDYNVYGIILWVAMAMFVVGKTIKRSRFELLFIILVSLNLYVNIMAIAKVFSHLIYWKLPEVVVYSAWCIIILVIYVPLLWNLYLRCYKKIVEFDIQLSFWKFMWIIPVLTYAVFYVKIVDDYWRRTFRATNEDIMFSILWSLVTYVYFWLTLQMVIQSYKGISAIDHANLIASQLRMQQEQYGMLLENIEKTSRLRHDWRHHLLTMRALAEEENLEEIKQYLDVLVPDYSAHGDNEICENHVADAILRHYMGIGMHKDIHMSVKADIPAKVGIEDTDLCIVLGNLMENAVEASISQRRDRKYIEVTALMKGRQLVVVIKNTYQNTISIRDGVYYSTKHEGMGVGIPSVRKVVEKYEGVINMDPGKEYFAASLFLNTKKLQK